MRGLWGWGMSWTSLKSVLQALAGFGLEISGNPKGSELGGSRLDLP